MGTSGGPYITRDNGLVLAVDAADRNSFSGPPSTTWRDLTTNLNTLTLYNGTYYSTNGNGSFFFDGTNDGISGSNAAVYSITGSISLEAWIYALASDIFIMGKGPSNNTSSERPGNYELQINLNNRLSFLHQTTTASSNGAYATYQTLQDVFSNSTWTHVVATCNGTTATIYTNGVPNSTTRNVIGGTDGGLVSVNTQPLRIGRRTDGAIMSGSIAATRIYNRILSAGEVLQNYNEQRTRFELSTLPTTTTTTTTTSTTTTTTTALYTVTVRVGNSATRTIGGIAGVYYKLGVGGTKTTLATGITGPVCPTVSTVGTISNIPNGTVLYIGPQLGGTTDQTFGAGGCVGSPLVLCGFVTSPHIVTVNSNLTIDLHLNVVGGAYTTC